MARHYEPKFRLMTWVDIKDSWNCLDASDFGKIYRLIIILLIGGCIALGLCSSWSSYTITDLGN